MNRRGFAAILDGLLAYTVAFVAIGMLALLMMSTREAGVKTDYTLNVWAEDLANAIGQSMVNPTDPTKNWLSQTDTVTILPALQTSLDEIATEKQLAISVDIDGAPPSGFPTTIGSFDISSATKIVTARRLLVTVSNDGTYTPTGGVSVLTVKIGIK